MDTTRVELITTTGRARGTVLEVRTLSRALPVGDRPAARDAARVTFPAVEQGQGVRVTTTTAGDGYSVDRFARAELTR